MTSRERVLTALNHETPDRMPCDFWAEPPTWNRLLAHVGCEPGDRDGLLDHLEIDVRHLDPTPPPDRVVGDGVFENFWGERFIDRATDWGPLRGNVDGALGGARHFEELEAFPWPDPDCLDRSSLPEQCRKYADHALLYGSADVWQRPALVRGCEGFFLDMAERPAWAHFLSRKFTDFYLEDYTRAAEITQGRIDLFLLASDLGGQRGPLISMTMFHEFVAPYLKEMIDRIHDLGARVLYHSCGAVLKFIPELIKLGVDVLNPIQPVGPSMAPESLKAEFGGRIAFHGGIDLQQVLSGASPQQVRTAVRHYRETLGAEGGYILSPAHLFQPDVPPENILAVYATER